MRRNTLVIATTLLLLCSPASGFKIVAGGPAYCFPQPIELGLNNFPFDLTRQANVGWTRITLRWRDVNPSQGVWNFSAYDGLINAAQAEGLQILVLLSTAPQWAGGGANGNTPPTNMAYWNEFVRRTAQRYNGKVAAYEVWNEPDISGSSSPGVGWDRNLTQYPRYVDYLRGAAKKIRAYSPGTLVVGPVSRSEPNNKTVELFRQIEQTIYTDGPGSSFVDVISFHAGAENNQSTSKINDWIDSHLSTLRVQNPSNALKPVWITEYGWKSDKVGEASQRDRIMTITEDLSGSGIGLWLFPSCSNKRLHKITHAFIYKIQDTPDERSGVYRLNGTAKPVTTDYLQLLPFPARHPSDVYLPMTSNCSGLTCTFTLPLTNPPGGAYETYFWDFGDGTTQVGASQTVTHTYSASGRYFVAAAAAFALIDATDVRLIHVN